MCSGYLVLLQRQQPCQELVTAVWKTFLEAEGTRDHAEKRLLLNAAQVAAVRHHANLECVLDNLDDDDLSESSFECTSEVDAAVDAALAAVDASESLGDTRHADFDAAVAVLAERLAVETKDTFQQDAMREVLAEAQAQLREMRGAQLPVLCKVAGWKAQAAQWWKHGAHCAALHALHFGIACYNHVHNPTPCAPCASL